MKVTDWLPIDGRRVLGAVLCLAPLLATVPARAAGDVLYLATLTPQNGAVSLGAGHATLLLAANERTAALRHSFSNLSTVLTAAHIHAPDGQILFDLDIAEPAPDGTLTWTLAFDAVEFESLTEEQNADNHARLLQVQSALDELRGIRIEELDFSQRTFNCLRPGRRRVAHLASRRVQLRRLRHRLGRLVREASRLRRRILWSAGAVLLIALAVFVFRPFWRLSSQFDDLTFRIGMHAQFLAVDRHGEGHVQLALGHHLAARVALLGDELVGGLAFFDPADESFVDAGGPRAGLDSERRRGCAGLCRF